MAWSKRNWGGSKRHLHCDELREDVVCIDRDHNALIVHFDCGGERAAGISIPLDLIRELIAAHDADMAKRGDVEMVCSSGCDICDSCQFGYEKWVADRVSQLEQGYRNLHRCFATFPKQLTRSSAAAKRVKDEMDKLDIALGSAPND